ncbi:MAG: methylmalonyl-CoA epimerase [Desulfuromonadaceae bacterium]|nr:methylmalonyl-CoA epimerase [Desulfuromonadaceae bacterium]
MLKKINHIGIAVHNLEEAMPHYGGLFGMTFTGIEEVVGYQVKVAFFQIGESKIELLEPTGNESIIYKFLNTNGPGIHHIAYEVDDLAAAIKQLEAKGIRMIDRAPRHGAHGTMIAFINPESSRGILTELCQVGSQL